MGTDSATFLSMLENAQFNMTRLTRSMQAILANERH